MKKLFILICVLLAVSLLEFVSSKPSGKDKDNPEYNYDDLLNDDEAGVYNENEDNADEDVEDEEDENSDKSPPVIQSESLKLTAKPGETVNLPCATENAEAYSIMWKKNGTMLFQDRIQVGYKNSRYSRLQNQTLQIANVTLNDSAEYECSISTSPDLTTVKHQLNVLSPARIVSVMPANGVNEIRMGSVFELICQAEGNPKPRISWSKQGARLTGKMGMPGTYDGSVVMIENVGKEHAGIYQCLAENSIGAPDTSAVEIVITHPPAIKIEKMIVIPTETHLICIVHALPKADVIWMKNNELIRQTNNIRVENPKHSHRHTIKILKSKDSDFGNYTCRASNKLGHTEKHIVFTGNPSTPVSDTEKFIGDNNDFLVQWSVESMWPISEHQLQYRKKNDNRWNSVQLNVTENTPGHIYTVTHLFKELSADEFEARLRSKNKYGWSQFSHGISFSGKNEGEPLSISENNEAVPSLSSAANRGVTLSSILLFTIVTLNLFSTV